MEYYLIALIVLHTDSYACSHLPIHCGFSNFSYNYNLQLWFWPTFHELTGKAICCSFGLQQQNGFTFCKKMNKDFVVDMRRNFFLIQLEVVAFTWIFVKCKTYDMTLTIRWYFILRVVSWIGLLRYAYKACDFSHDNIVGHY